jgi:hypothetical protein
LVGAEVAVGPTDTAISVGFSEAFVGSTTGVAVVAVWQAKNSILAIRARLRKAKTFLDVVTPFLLVGLYLVMVDLLCLIEEPILWEALCMKLS